jgi:hypothetical protein
LNKLLVSSLTVIAILSTTVLSVFAAPSAAKSTEIGPFDGEFHGRVYGNDGTSAPLSLVMTHKGEQVEGTAFLGNGLFVDAGWCGAGYLPASNEYASGHSSPSNPRHISTESTFNVEGFDVTVELDANASSNGESIEAEATIDLPWLCGRDPVLTGTLYKAS